MLKHRLKAAALALVALMACGSTRAATLNETDHFSCTIDSQEDFNLWSVHDVDGDGNKWHFYSNWSTARFEGGYDAGNDWLISPEVTIATPGEFIVKCDAKGHNGSMKLQLFYGTTPDVSAMQAIAPMESFRGDHTVSGTADLAAGKYYFGLKTTSELWDGTLLVYGFEVAANNFAAVTFTVLNDETDQPVAGASVKLEGDGYSRSTTTGPDGKTAYELLNPGDYTVSFSAEGYHPAESQSLTLGAKENKAISLMMSKIHTATFKGQVVNYNGKAVEDATVELSGENSYRTVTDADGRYFIDGIIPGSYDVTVSKITKKPYTATVTLGEDTPAQPTVTLENFFGNPVQVTADKTEAGHLVSWMMSVGEGEFHIDDGQYRGMFLQTGPLVEYVRYGVELLQPQIVEEVSWAVCELEDGMVDIGVYLIDANGEISRTPAYEKKGVPSDTYSWIPPLEWQRHRLDVPVTAPYGCVVSVGHSSAQPIRICTDYLLPFDHGNSVVSINDLSTGWGHTACGNFMIRSKGIMLSRDLIVDNMKAPRLRSAGSTPARAASAPVEIEGVDFKVWRLTGTDKNNPGAWTPLRSNSRSLYLIDPDMESCPQGVYHYAVQAVNHDGTESDIALSAPIAHRLTTDVTVKVFTNSQVNYADGAVATLIPEETSQSSLQVIVKGNRARFNAIPKGMYTLVVEKDGFVTSRESKDWRYESSYDEVTVELALDPYAPYGLAAENTGNGEVTLSWNNGGGIFEDFESMPDFEMNPAGEIGWSYIDGDGELTYYPQFCESTPYPNMSTPKAFMVMNPYKTTPVLTPYIRPFSGEKVLISASLRTGGVNDDYMFSPELSFDRPFTLRFRAAAGFYAAYGNEEFMVGYTTGGTSADDVTWLTETPETVGANWQEFSYTMPAEARHTVIRCVSDQIFFFMLDDIYIGRTEPEIFGLATFNVYIDDELVSNTIGRTITLNGLEQGKHLAKVQTVYPMTDGSNTYSDFAELLFTAGTNSLDMTAAEKLYDYNAATRTLVAGETVETMTLHDTMGRPVGTGREITVGTPGVYVLRLTTASGAVTRKLTF